MTAPVKNKSAVVGIGYFGGLSAVAAFGANLNFIPVIIAASALAVIFGFLLKWRKSRKILNFSAAALLLTAFAAGAVHFYVYDANTRQPVFEAAIAGETVTIDGTVTEKKTLAYNRASYLIKTRVNGKNTRILLNSDDADIKEGDTVTAEATLSQLRNTGLFPEKNYNLSRGVLLKGESDYVELVKNGRANPLKSYGNFVKNKIITAFPNDVGGLLIAVFFGDKSELSREMSANITTAGTAHYTAVSGLHMTMIAHMFMFAFALTPYRNNRKVKFAVLAVITATLAIFFGLSVSVIRSAIMLNICYGGELFMRKGNTLNSLGFALLLILMVQPYAVFDAGLIMSFSGTFGVGVLAPAIMKRNRSEDSVKAGKLGKIAESFTAAVCAAICILPASAVYFGGISALSPITSVIILPFFTIAAGAVMLYSLLAGLSFISVIGYVANAFLLCAAIMSKAIGAIIGFFGNFSAAYISLDYWFVPIWLALALTAVAVTSLIYKSGIKSFKCACLTIATLSLMICVYNANTINSGKTYIRIYSDGTSAWAIAEQSGVKAVIVTHDTVRAAEELALTGRNAAVISLLNSTKNNSAAFANIPALEYISPQTGAENQKFDISGKFKLDIGETAAVLETKEHSIVFTRAANDNAESIKADVVVAYNQVRKKRKFNSDRIIYSARNVPIEYDNEHSAYYEPIYLIIENGGSP